MGFAFTWEVEGEWQGVDREIFLKLTTTNQSIDDDCSIWDDEMHIQGMILYLGMEGNYCIANIIISTIIDIMMCSW